MTKPMQHIHRMIMCEGHCKLFLREKKHHVYAVLCIRKHKTGKLTWIVTTRPSDGRLGSRHWWRAWQATKCFGEVHAAFEPEIPEWDISYNPRGWGTWGTEASQYPEEKKSIEIPLVTASEHGIGQTESSAEMWWRCGVIRLDKGP